MRKLGLLIALLFVLAGCADQPQPAVSPIPMAAPSISGVDMLAGDELGVTCDGLATLAGDLLNYTLSCAALIVVDIPIVTEIPTAVATVTEAATATDVPTDAETPTGTATATATDTVVPVATATAEPTATDTSTPTATATATATPLPTATAISMILPYPGAPKCANHDAAWWHALWNPALGCHYDHEHGSNPDGMAGYVISGTTMTYGSLAAFSGQQLGYVWQTTNENLYKHSGYHINTAVNLPCEQQNYLYLPTSARKCVRSFRIVAHVDHAVREGLGRFHSFSAEVEGCNRTYTRCGIIRTGGLNDTGDAHAPYKETCVEPVGSNRPSCPTAAVWDYQRHNPPYWAFTVRTKAEANLAGGYLCRNVSCQNLSGDKMVWENLSADRTMSLGNRLGVANRLLHMNLRTYNAASYYDPADKTFKFVCPLGNCNATGDAVYVYAVAFDVPASLAVNGVVNYQGFTDRAGRISTSCTVAGVECVPLEIRNLEPGTYIYDMSPGFIPGVRNWGDGTISNGARYFDTTPAGESASWIEIK